MNKQKVLFIGIGFYDYEEAIINEFKRQNYDVDYYNEVPRNTLIYRLFSRLNYHKKINHIHYNHSLNIADSCGTDYNLVFILKGECLSSDALMKIRTKNPSAKYILYLWDSLARIKGVAEKFCFFNRIYSFDRIDCLTNEELIFNPLFFRDEYNNTATNEVLLNDVYHLGWYHSDRLKLIKKLSSFCEKNFLRSRLLLFTGYFSYLFQRLSGGELKSNRKYLIFKALSTEENRKNILHSKAVLDISHPKQSGLTIRTIELLGMNRKIITTNQDITNYDFFCSENVLLIDREAPVFEIFFFSTNYKPIPSEIKEKYNISNWLKRMLID